MADPAILVGSDRLILVANDRANVLFGWEDDGLVGQPMDVLLPEGLKAAHEEWSRGFLERPDARIMGENPKLEGVRKDGERIPLDISLSPIKIQGELHVLVIIRNLKAIASRVSIPINELSSLSEIARLVSGPMETTEIFKRVARQVRPLIPYDQLFICALDQGSAVLRHHYIVGGEITGHDTGSTVTLNESQMSGLLSMNQPTTFIDGAGPAWFGDAGEDAHLELDDLNSMLAAPLRWNGEVIGTLILRSRSEALYTQESLKLSEQIASVLASVVAKSRFQVIAAESIDQRSILANIGRLIGDVPDIRSVIDSLAAQIDQLIPIDGLVLTRVGVDRGRCFIEAQSGSHDPIIVPGVSYGLPGTATEKAMSADSSTIFSSEQIRAFDSHNYPDGPAPIQMRSWLAVPLKLRGNTLGAMHFRSYKANVYNSAHVDIAQAIAAQIAGAVGSDTAVLDHDRERRIRNSVDELTKAIVRGDQLEAMAGAIRVQLSEFVEFDRLSAATTDKERGEARLFYESGVKSDGIGVGNRFNFAGLASGDNSRIDTVSANGAAWKKRLAKIGINSWMYTVIGSDTGQAVGAIWVGADRHGAFDERDLEILDRLASVMVPQFHAHAHEMARQRLVEEHERSEALSHQTEVLEFEARAKSEFVGSITHEFKTPLTSVVAFSNILSHDTNLTERQMKHINLIQNNAARLERMINDLLDIAQANAGKLSYDISNVLVSEVVAEVCDGLRQVAHDAGRRLFYSCPPTNSTAAVDPTRFAQVLQNLISNAIKYSPDRSGITISTDEVDGQFQVLVRNRGALTAEQTSAAFIRFNRLDNEITRSVSGNGLGLSISRQIVEEMGGSLTLESNLKVVEAQIRIPLQAA